MLLTLLSVQLNAYNLPELLQYGSSCNNTFMYEEAVDVLNKVIEIDPSIRDAYRERAISHFELNDLDLAFRDYQSAKKMSLFYGFVSCIPMIGMSTTQDPSSSEFAIGFLSGVSIGSKQKTIEFLDSLRGSFSFLRNNHENIKSTGYSKRLESCC